MSKGSIILKGSIEELRRQFNLVSIRLNNVDQTKEDAVREYIRQSVMDECEVRMSPGNCMSIRLPFDSSVNLVRHVEYFEDSLGLIVDIKQTSLEDVYVMDGEFENYNTFESLGRVDMDDTWRQLITANRRIGMLKHFGLMMRKSSLSLPRPDDCR